MSLIVSLLVLAGVIAYFLAGATLIRNQKSTFPFPKSGASGPCAPRRAEPKTALHKTLF